MWQIGEKRERMKTLAAACVTTAGGSSGSGNH